MGGAVPSLPQYAFMAWCSFRGSTGTTLPLPFYCKRRTKKEVLKRIYGPKREGG
jgi:hypothetical protein